jgi:hypothetical protein
MADAPSDLVLGYGSLVVPGHPRAALRGHRRVWGVAMDNRVVVPGYKVYVDAESARPAVAVAFLDVEPDPEPGTCVTGTLLAVDAAALAALDRRERQYDRVDVTALVTGAPAGSRVWVYAGAPAGRARAQTGRTLGAGVVIQRAYLERVERAHDALGAGALQAYRAATEPPPFPVVDLERRDVPAA